MDENTVLIIVLGLAYALIEAAQLLYVAFQAKRTADALDRLTSDEELAGRILKNGFVGMSKLLKEDEQARNEFFGLVSIMGEIAYHAAVDGAREKIKSTIAKEIPVPKKYRWLYDLGQQYFGGGDTGKTPPKQAAGDLPPL